MLKSVVFFLFVLICTSATVFAGDIDQPARSKNKKQHPGKPATPVASFVSSNIRFVKDSARAFVASQKWETVAWKGEKVHTQILVDVASDLSNLSVKALPLTGKNGKTLPVNTGFVRFVITDEFGDGCGGRKPGDFDSSYAADPIDIVSEGPVKKGMQPVWLSVSVPQDAEPGVYKGIINVIAGSKKNQLHYTVTVINRVLPPASQWSFDLDFWQHPAAIARVHNVKLWSREHYAFMKPYYTLLASAGQKNITTSIINEPWNHQTYDDFPGLIKWTKKADGSWSYDYTLFDEYVEFVMSCGITKRINCYSMVPWELSFPYFDEATQKETFIKAQTGSPEYNAFWKVMLVDFTAHLKSKGWFEKTTIAMDERPMKDMQAVIALLREVDPGWKIALAGDYHPEIENDIFEYCVASRWQYPSDVSLRRRSAGKPTTFYTCCVEAYPNGFTFSPPAEHVFVGWYAAANDFTGYLRWAYNSWVKDPLKDSRFHNWPAGDTYQVYPGPLTSIRFEKLIEGIQDFEKIQILLKEWKGNGQSKELIALGKVLDQFKIEALKTNDAASMVENAKKIINQPKTY